MPIGASNLKEANLPRILLVIDELADIMSLDRSEAESCILALLQSGRTTGIHVIVSTFSRKYITPSMKAGFPSKVSFSVSSAADSKAILNVSGAEKLSGPGVMLFNLLGSPESIKLQSCYLPDLAIDNAVTHIKANCDTQLYETQIIEELSRHIVSEQNMNVGSKSNNEDELLPMAIECVVEAGQASTSLLQRRLKLGYARAATMIDLMQQQGIVGPFEGSKPREVLITKEQWINKKLNETL